MVENSKYIAVSVSEDATDALLGCLEQPIAKTGDSIAHETPLSDEEQRDYVSRILALPDFPERLGALLAQSSELLPEITVRCDGLNVTSRAIIGTSALPSLSNVALSVVRKATCQRSLPSKEITLVDNLSCVFRPGRSTLLLGPPGAGKSLFLSLLGDRVKSSKELKVSGNITYNGATKSDFIVQRSVGWISQEELLLPSMTVEETVNFAYQCLVPKHRRSFLAAEIGSVNDTNSKKQQDVAAVDTAAEPNTEVDTEAQGPTMSDQEFAEAIRKLAASGGKVQTVLAMLGLLRCAKTKVGSAAIRGVSGGERRRVSIAEVLVGPQAVILADQITNGLDSATTFTVIEFMTRAVRQMKRTCIAALLQPAPEVMNLFDDLMLLSDGHLLYYGPVQDALPWFSSLGFERPPRKDPCSFLQELTVPLGQLKYASDAMLKEKGMEAMAASIQRDPHALAKLQGTKTKPPMALSEMRDVYYKSNATALAMRADLDEKCAKPAWPIKGLYHKAYASKSYQLALAVYNRQRGQMKRQRSFFVARMIQALVMGALRGSMFWQIPATSAGGRLVISCNTTTVVFLSMLSTPQVTIVFNQKAVFIKQRDDCFYPPWSFALALFLTQIFQSLVESVIYSIAVYFMAGFTYSASYFFRFYLVTFITSNTLAGLTRFFAYVFPNKVLATSILSCVILINQITNGFNILYKDIPDWLIWLYWLNPVQWALSALNVLELTSPRWDIPSSNSTEPLGIQVLQTYDMKTDINWVYYAVAYLLGLLVVLTVAGAIVLGWTKWPGPQNTVDDDIEDESTLLESYSTKNSGMEKVLSPSTTANVDNVDLTVPNTNASLRNEGHKPVTVVCRNLTYCVPTPKGAKPTPDAIKPGMLQILTDITLYAKPGRLTALMGGTGSGKTTLMDVVCGRKTVGYISGEILINGHPVDKATWPQMHGYVEQQNLHSPQLTVEEALIFSGSLRLPRDRQSPASVQAAVEDTLRITELTPLRKRITGTPLGGGLSSEALKRLSIAVELVADPSVLFMDEPTTGLDARAAAIVVRALESIAATGRTIMVTIHQPSMDVFEAFDDLVLLKMGGRIMYFGPLGENSSNVVSYFGAYDGVLPLTAGYNPATWMLEVTGSSMSTIFKAANNDFVELYQQSSRCTVNTAAANQLVSEAASASVPMVNESKYAAPVVQRYKMIMWKFFLIYWRSPHYNFIRMVLTLGVALLYGLVYYKQGSFNPEGASIGDVQNVLGLLFSMAVFMGMFNANNVLPLLFNERPVYYRERAAGMYGPLSYSFATGVVELPYLLVQALIMVCISYWLVGFAAIAWKFFYFLLMFFTSLCVYTYMGNFMATISPSLLMAVLIVSVFSQTWTIVNGYLIPYSQIPIYWRWLNRITPATWIIYGLGTSQLGDIDAPMVGIGGEMTTVSGFLYSFFGYEYSFIWWAWVITLAFAIVFRMGSGAALKLFNFNKR